jgi:hypothetical protein
MVDVTDTNPDTVLKQAILSFTSQLSVGQQVAENGEYRPFGACVGRHNVSVRQLGCL